MWWPNIQLNQVAPPVGNFLSIECILCHLVPKFQFKQMMSPCGQILTESGGVVWVQNVQLIQVARLVAQFSAANIQIFSL